MGSHDYNTGDNLSEERVRMSEGGRIVIPQRFREASTSNPVMELVLHLEGICLRVCSIKETIRQAQAVVRSYVAEDRSLVDELIRDRKREGNRE